MGFDLVPTGTQPQSPSITGAILTRYYHTINVITNTLPNQLLIIYTNYQIVLEEDWLGGDGGCCVWQRLLV